VIGRGGLVIQTWGCKGTTYIRFWIGSNVASVTSFMLAWDGTTLHSHCGNFGASSVIHLVISTSGVSNWNFAAHSLFSNSFHVTTASVAGRSGGASSVSGWTVRAGTRDSGTFGTLSESGGNFVTSLVV
jgi:hypothetical protein